MRCELFRLERRQSFQRFFELLMPQSGGIFEASGFATPCEVSRTAIANYLTVLDATFAVHVIRPFAKSRDQEIVSAPRVYGFDTGFVCYYRGWTALRQTDMGSLSEHFVLNELCAHLQSRAGLHYWRTKQAREIDFVLVRRCQPPVAIECKWRPDHFEPGARSAFRHRCTDGTNFVVVPKLDRAATRSFDSVQVRFVDLSGLLREIDVPGRRLRPP